MLDSGILGVAIGLILLYFLLSPLGHDVRALDRGQCERFQAGAGSDREVYRRLVGVDDQ